MLMLMLSIRRHFEPARSVSDIKIRWRLHTSPLGAPGSLSEKNISKPNARQRLPKEKIRKLAKKSIEDRFREKISQPMSVKDRPKKIQKLAKKSIEDRSAKNFPTDVRRRLPKEKFGSWQRSPSKIAPRKISQLMCVEDYPKKNSEVGEEVHRRSLREKFPNRCPSKIAQRRNSEVGEEAEPPTYTILIH